MSMTIIKIQAHFMICAYGPGFVTFAWANTVAYIQSIISFGDFGTVWQCMTTQLNRLALVIHDIWVHTGHFPGGFVGLSFQLT